MAKYQIDGVKFSHSNEEGTYILFSKAYGKLASFTERSKALSHKNWKIATGNPASLIDGHIVKDVKVYERRGREFVHITE